MVAGLFLLEYSVTNIVMVNKAYKVRLYPNNAQQILIDKSIGCYRFIYNQMLRERIDVYEALKEDKESLYNHEYKSEKEYKEEYPFLREVPSRALQQARLDLNKAYSNFFRRVKKGEKAGFPKFKSKKKHKRSYRDPQVGNQIRVEGRNLIMPKLGPVKMKGLSKYFKGEIKSVTVTKTRSNKYIASILVEQESDKKKRYGNNVNGIDLGLKEFAVTSNGDVYKGVKR